MHNITTTNQLKKNCRICFEEQPHMRFLSSSELMDGRFYTLAHMLKCCTSIQVNLDETLPNMICQKCINRLYSSWDFKVDCEKSEEKIHNQFNINRSVPEIEETINLESNSSEVVPENIPKTKNKEKDLNILQVITIKNVNRSLKLLNNSITENTKKVITDNLDQILKENNGIINNAQIRKCLDNSQLSATPKTKLIMNLKPLNTIKQELLPTIQGETIDLTLDVEDSKKSEEESDTCSSTCSDTCSEYPNTNNNNNNNNNNKRKLKVGGHECLICDKKFTTTRDLNLHMKSHTEDPETYSCPICDSKFEIFSLLEMHIKTHVGREKTLKCPKCSKYFLSLTMLNKHKKLHEIQHYGCELCCKKFISQPTLQKHLEYAHSGVNKFFCDVCMQGFAEKTMLQHHKKKHDKEDESFKCNVCDMSFSTFEKLTEHCYTHWAASDDTPPPPSFMCNECDGTFTTDDLLKKHKKKHHGSAVAAAIAAKTPLIHCEFCSTVFYTKYALAKHMQQHKKRLDSLTCRFCKKAFCSTDEITNHINTHFTCDECSLSFENSRKLNVHKKKHSSSLKKTIKMQTCN